MYWNIIDIVKQRQDSMRNVSIYFYQEYLSCVKHLIFDNYNKAAEFIATETGKQTTFYEVNYRINKENINKSILRLLLL